MNANNFIHRLSLFTNNVINIWTVHDKFNWQIVTLFIPIIGYSR